jgi:hypothetical protein
MDLSVLIEPKLDLARLADVLDGLGHEGRVHAVRRWNKRTQASLFEASQGHLQLGLDFLVPDGVDSGVEIIHEGQNTLPFFSHFQKRFCKLEGEVAPIAGYNHQALLPLTGPGYFVVNLGTGEHAGELAIDYTSVPKSKPDAWPAVEANDSGMGALVYGGMIDYLRGISRHVSIGRAYKDKAMSAWFALVRKDFVH